MNYLTPNVPEMFEKFYEKFDSIFIETSQRENFRLYGTALLLEIKRKNIQSLSFHMIDGNYQSLHHFTHDSPWNEGRLNSQRIELLERRESQSKLVKRLRRRKIVIMDMSSSTIQVIQNQGPGYRPFG